MLDPIILELIQTRLTSVVREMRSIMIRTAFSPMIHEGHDFSCAILSPNGDLAAASEVEQPTHISALPWSARNVIKKYDGDIGVGDLFLHNDPFTGGSHLNDVALYYPVFSGETLIFILGVMAHWQDIGGMVPGSLSGTATEIFQEGIRIPGIRISKGHQINEEAQDLLFANVRQPSERRGDLKAMIGACTVAERRLHNLIERWDAETIQSGVLALINRAETRMREAITRVPNGIYSYETYLDNTGDKPEPLFLKLSLSINDDNMCADFTGCAPQVPGPTNLGPATSTTAVFTMSKALLDPDGPINAGAMRPISVNAPLGTVVNAQPPAACGAIGEVRRALESLVVGALGKAIPNSLVGDLKGASNITAIGGRYPDVGGDFLFAEFPAGGTGAFFGGDGNNTMRNFAEGDISSIQPIESVELTCPLRIESTSLRVDSGGAGKWRGGLGLKREIRLLAPHARLSILSDKNIIPPYGVRRGHSSAPNRFTVRRNYMLVFASKLPGKVTAFDLYENDVVIEETAGGGGYGEAIEREPESVVRDVTLGYVSSSSAKSEYGVILSKSGYDELATQEKREQMGSNRLKLCLTGILEPEFDGSKRLVRVSDSAAKAIGSSDGGLIEIPNANGPSLRSWLCIDNSIDPGSCAIGCSAFSILDVKMGDMVELRNIEGLGS